MRRAGITLAAAGWLLLEACGDADPDSSAADAGRGPPGGDAAADAALPARSTVMLPGAEPGIGFDDLQFAATLDRVLIPAGRAGYVGLVDPATEEVTELGEFSTSDTYAGGHDFGTTSAIEVDGLVYALDRTTRQLHQLDPDSGASLSMIALAAAPDYVRFVKSTRELWVTEPGASQFQIFKLSDADPPTMQSDGTLTVAGGPESFVLDDDGAIGYTNTFLGSTIQVDVATRDLTATWDNGCTISLGLALDTARQRVFVGCSEGKAVTLDAAADGAQLSMLEVGVGVDIISFSPSLSHLYLNGSAMGQLTIADVSAGGELSQLTTLDTAPSTNSSCVLGDPHGNVWVCDANAGQLFRFSDTF
jgi:streptogramin lyase